MTEADALSEPLLYSSLAQHDQKVFIRALKKKLRSLMGPTVEIDVLVDYIEAMLESSRTFQQLQSEMEPFLQAHTQPFTDWIYEFIQQFIPEGLVPASAAEVEDTTADVLDLEESHREELLMRAVRDARAEAINAGGLLGSEAVQEPGVGEKDRLVGHRVLEQAVAGVRSDRRKKKGRDRSRSRRRTSGRWHFRAEPMPTEWQGSAPSGPPSVHVPPSRPPSVVLTPAPHAAGTDYAPAPSGETGASAAAAAGIGVAPAFPGAGGPRPYYPPPIALVTTHRPKNYKPKKWTVVRDGTVVRTTEQLNSPEVQTMKVGEIVEQVSPSFTLPGGIVRIQIRHPSSPFFPDAIGWVTQDASAAGGPVFLEPGPEPLQQRGAKPRPGGPGVRPFAPGFRPPRAFGASGAPGRGGGSGGPRPSGVEAAAAGVAARPKGWNTWVAPGLEPPKPRPRPPRPAQWQPRASPKKFHQNLTWTPEGKTAAAGGPAGSAPTEASLAPAEAGVASTAPDSGVAATATAAATAAAAMDPGTAADAPADSLSASAAAVSVPVRGSKKAIPARPRFANKVWTASKKLKK